VCTFYASHVDLKCGLDIKSEMLNENEQETSTEKFSIWELLNNKNYFIIYWVSEKWNFINMWRLIWINGNYFQGIRIYLQIYWILVSEIGKVYLNFVIKNFIWIKRKLWKCYENCCILLFIEFSLKLELWLNDVEVIIELVFSLIKNLLKNKIYKNLKKIFKKILNFLKKKLIKFKCLMFFKILNLKKFL